MRNRFIEKKPEISFLLKWPKVSSLEPDRTIVIYDAVLMRVPGFPLWVGEFPNRYQVQSGEELKELSHFPDHMRDILKLTEQTTRRPLQILSIGGGSVGDFSSFVASILKRGVDLVHIPSTWLAAIDSAHGGKNALNVDGIKNQIGSFYAASRILIIQSLLFSQPLDRAEEALGEILKIGIVSGGGLYRSIAKAKDQSTKTFWNLLPDLIDAKYKIVSKDPYEEKGIRSFLNLGHTVGHVIESELKMAHGLAVLYGLGFALAWSKEKKMISQKNYERIFQTDLTKLIPREKTLAKVLSQLKDVEAIISQDKKRTNKMAIKFIFIQDVGKPKMLPVSVEEIIAEIQRQGQI
jgi:3-dehydroquinate synthase